MRGRQVQHEKLKLVAPTPAEMAEWVKTVNFHIDTLSQTRAPPRSAPLRSRPLLLSRTLRSFLSPACAAPSRGLSSSAADA